MTATALALPSRPTTRPGPAPRLLLPARTEPRPAAVPSTPLALVLARSVLSPPPAAPAAPRDDLPDPGRVAGAVALAALEVLVGLRPVAQLSRWVSPAVLDQVASRVGQAGPPRRATVRSTRVDQPTAEVAEVGVVLHDGRRVRAAAVRLEVHRARWRATVLQIG